MKVAIPKEIAFNENRVASVPEMIPSMIKAGMEVNVEAGAGEAAYFHDAAYEKAGAVIVKDTARLYGEADLILKVLCPIENQALGKHEVSLMREGAVLVAFFQAATVPDVVQMLVDRNITCLSMAAIPRITRAQSMDVSSSQSTVAGYKAAVIAADSLGRFLPMLNTAAGTVPPAKVLVIGAGVAGLQAIATARRLGAVVFGFDVRPAVKEQVESLGAKFLQVELAEKDNEDEYGYAKQLSEESRRRERELLAKSIRGMDAVITIAAVPGKDAPKLITKDMVESMKPGSVIVDMASNSGGNCELTEPGKMVRHNGVTICGYMNLASRMPIPASQMYARNIDALLKLLCPKGQLNLDFNDEIIKSMCVTRQGNKMF